MSDLRVQARHADDLMRRGAALLKKIAHEDPSAVPDDTAAKAAVVLGALPAFAASNVQELVINRLKMQGGATTQVIAAELGLKVNTMAGILTGMKAQGKIHSRALYDDQGGQLWMMPDAVSL